MLHSLVSSGHLSPDALASLWGATAAAGKVDPSEGAGCSTPASEPPSAMGAGQMRQWGKGCKRPHVLPWSEAEKQALRGYMARNGVGGYPGGGRSYPLTAAVAASIVFWQAASREVAAACGTAPRGIATIYAIALKLRDGRL